MTNWRGVVAYFVTACLARAADAGAVVGVVLLGSEIAPKTALAGLLAACLTVPHLAAPFAGRFLDRTRRKRALLAVAMLTYGCALAGATLLMNSGAQAAAATALLIAGACGPLLTGGLSSQLAGLVAARESAQRRAQGMDALTYGVAATGGPALLAVLALTTNATVALLAIVALELAATVTMALVPLVPKTGSERKVEAMTVRQTLAVMFGSGPLRRVTVGTALCALPLGALPIIAVAFAVGHGGTASLAAVFIASLGFGSLLGAVGVTIRPIGGSPERATRLGVVAVALSLTLCLVAPGPVLGAGAFFLVGVASAGQFAATLASRSTYSPPNARAQIFVTMAGIKVAFQSLGVSVAGLVAGVGWFWLLIGGILIALFAAAAMLVDMRRHDLVLPQPMPSDTGEREA